MVTGGHGWSRVVTGRALLFMKEAYFWVTGGSRVVTGGHGSRSCIYEGGVFLGHGRVTGGHG